MAPLGNHLAGAEQLLLASLNVAQASLLVNQASRAASAHRAISQSAQLTGQLESQRARLQQALERLSGQ